MVSDFIYCIESKSIYWGGGYSKYYIQGCFLYAEENLNLNKMSFSEELAVFFQSLNKDIKLEIKLCDIDMNCQKCYCCGYFSLEKMGVAEICLVCFWEDDGEIDLDVISNPNRMTLRKGRENFSKFGSCERQFIKNVVKNPETKFRKENF